MAKSSNQKLKLIYLMRYLLDNTDENHGVTVKDIIAYLDSNMIGAERKSVYDDIEALRDFGIDIDAVKESGNVITYRVVSRDFELAELKLLVDSVQASKFITRKKSEELIKKIESLASKHGAQQLRRQVFVSNRIKTMNESIYYSVDYLNSAITENKKITFKYFDWNEKKQKVLRHNGQIYEVSPWALMWDDENYYLIAYDGKAKKHYRVDRMVDMAITDKEREGGELLSNVDTALYSKQTFGMFGGSEETVKLRCHNSLANVMVDRFGQDTAFFSVDSEHFDIVVKLTVSPVFLSWVATFGSDIEIISPDSVIDEYLALMKRATDKYCNKEEKGEGK
ncbi:MAG: WYL domain-containing protein [Clostridia bacterium]|nr:WYL domain-containing protein [Clostridia bacterium]